MAEENTTHKVRNKVMTILTKILLSILAILAGCAFIIIGTYLLPVISSYMIENNRLAVNLFEFLFYVGIVGGAIFLTYYGFKVAFKETN